MRGLMNDAGQTWFTIPETVGLRLVNGPPKGIGDRVVEFSGPGLQYLSCDARFAISNMCTEFGAVTGIFEADEQTMKFINRRHQTKHKSKAVFFKPDKDAEYAEQYTIDLAKVRSFIAIHPSPENVVPVGEVAGKELNGFFIGACTTAEEDLIIGSMIPEAGLAIGKTPVNSGRRLVVPGSRPISSKLDRLGLLDNYRKAGFKIGVPGCSMCVGQGTDQAQSGETWLSSQNRNFKNRMGPGSIAYLGSAATVAASSFGMQITDPQELLDTIDIDRLRDMLGRRLIDLSLPADIADIQYKEPYGIDSCKSEGIPTITQSSETTDAAPVQTAFHVVPDQVEGRALVVGDFIDTDAIIPSKFLATSFTDEELGSHCMEFFMPEFREMAQNGQSIVVAGRSFGVGSSRDVAVNALKSTGIKAVIARSFVFIYARNQPNLCLLGITITDDNFYELARDGVPVRIDMATSEVECCGEKFQFTLSDMEKRLIAAGGIMEAFKSYGKKIFNELCKPLGKPKREGAIRDIEEYST